MQAKPVHSLTPTRAIFIWLIRQYELMGKEITALVIQKLAYLLQRCGEDLKLRFEKGFYGPYSPNLNKVLESLYPKYITYTGDLNKPATRIDLVPGSKKETKRVIDHELVEAQKARLEKVQKLIEGFENTFGLELLATVAYVREQCPDCTKNMFRF